MPAIRGSRIDCHWWGGGGVGHGGAEMLTTIVDELLDLNFIIFVTWS
jgi:hypothetical protein